MSTTTTADPPAGTADLPGIARNQDTAGDPAAGTSRTRGRGARITLAVLAVVALALGAGYLWLSATAQVHSLGEQDCEAVALTTSGATESSAEAQAQARICTTVTTLSQAWAAHDAQAYGAAFTADATYTTFMGTHYAGREDIVRSHRALFDGPLEGTRLADSFLGIDLVTDDVAVVTTRGDTYEGAEPGDLTKVQTYTMVRQADGSWLIASFHNTQRSPVMERIQFLMEPDSRPSSES